jgi:hypothetical protein
MGKRKPREVTGLERAIGHGLWAGISSISFLDDAERRLEGQWEGLNDDERFSMAVVGMAVLMLVGAAPTKLGLPMAVGLNKIPKGG